jgi:hypothetical protein
MAKPTEEGYRIFSQCFRGPEHEYQCAIQDAEYLEKRGDYAALTWRVSPPEKAKEIILKDYARWRKTNGLNLS